MRAVELFLAFYSFWQSHYPKMDVAFVVNVVNALVALARRHFAKVVWLVVLVWVRVFASETQTLVPSQVDLY